MSEMKDIFEFTEVDEKMSGIRITEGDYKGLHWTFGTVSFGEEANENGEMSCKFDYVLHDNPSNIEENQELINFMGDILIEVLDRELALDEELKFEDIPLPPTPMSEELINTKAILDHMKDTVDEDS